MSGDLSGLKRLNNIDALGTAKDNSKGVALTLVLARVLFQAGQPSRHVSRIFVADLSLSGHLTAAVFDHVINGIGVHTGTDVFQVRAKAAFQVGAVAPGTRSFIRFLRFRFVESDCLAASALIGALLILLLLLLLFLLLLL